MSHAINGESAQGDSARDRRRPEASAHREATSYGQRAVEDVAFELVVASGGLADEAPCDGFYVAGPECLEPAHWARVCTGCGGTIFSCHAHRRSWDEWVAKPPTGGRCTQCLTSLGVPIEWVTV